MRGWLTLQYKQRLSAGINLAQLMYPHVKPRDRSTPTQRALELGFSSACSRSDKEASPELGCHGNCAGTLTSELIIFVSPEEVHEDVVRSCVHNVGRSAETQQMDVRKRGNLSGGMEMACGTSPGQCYKA